MGELSDMMLDGKLCEWCGAYIEPGETCFQVTTLENSSGEYDNEEYKELKRPEDMRESLGFPVICSDCRYDVDITKNL